MKLQFFHKVLCLSMLGGLCLVVGLDVLHGVYAQAPPRAPEAVAKELELAKSDYNACRQNLADVLIEYDKVEKERQKLQTSMKPAGETPAPQDTSKR